jgi:AraC-like DNA-binding protein
LADLSDAFRAAASDRAIDYIPGMRPPEFPATARRATWTTWLPLLWIAFGILLTAAVFRSTVALWPRSGLRFETFTDARSGGHSTASVDTSAGDIHLAVRLDSGAIWPMSGVILFLAPHGKGLDLSAPGDLRLEIGTSNLESLQMCLVEEIQGFTRDDRWQTARYDCQDLDLVPGTSRYDLPLDRFLTPPWWYSTAGVRSSQLGPETRRGVVRVIIQSGDGTPFHDLREVRIVRLETRSSRWVVAGTILGLSLLFAGFQVLWDRRRLRSTGTAQKGFGPVVFQPVEAISYGDREREAIIQCIAVDFPDADLSLEKVSRTTGVPLDRVTSHVKAASGLLFKAYLNRVRGEAARKLLLETDLPVSEVANRVGYGNVPHFNRIFRELFGTTPSALREQPGMPDPSGAGENAKT